jgi:hypothetical protein
MQIALDANCRAQQRRKTQTQKDLMEGEHLDCASLTRAEAILLFRA